MGKKETLHKWKGGVDGDNPNECKGYECVTKDTFEIIYEKSLWKRELTVENYSTKVINWYLVSWTNSDVEVHH